MRFVLRIKCLGLMPKMMAFNLLEREGVVMLYDDTIHSVAVLPIDPVTPTADGNQEELLTINAGNSVAQIVQILENVHPLSSNAIINSQGTVLGFSNGLTSNKIVPIDGGEYTDYSASYGFWDSTGGYGYFDNSGALAWTGSNENSDGGTSTSTSASVHLDTSVSKTDGSGGTTGVTFNGTTADGRNDNQLVTPNLKSVTDEILAATPGVSTANAYATTNGAHSTNSDHYTGNAVDINNINGSPVISATGTQLALQLEAQALADPNTRYVEGPGGNWYRTSVGGTWIRSNDLPTMWNHVHWSVFRH